MHLDRKLPDNNTMLTETAPDPAGGVIEEHWVQYLYQCEGM